MIQKITILQILLIVLILILGAFSTLLLEISGLVLAGLTFVYILSTVPIYYTKSKQLRLLMTVNSLLLLGWCLSFGELAFYLRLGIVFLVGVLQYLICFFLAKESSSDLQEEWRHVQAFESKIDKNGQLSGLTKVSYGLMLASLLVQSFVPTLFLLFLLVVKYLVDCYARVKLVKLVRGSLLLNYLVGLILLEQLVYIGLFCLLWTGSHLTLYVGVLAFSNFLIPLLKQREYRLSRQLIAGKGQDFPDL
ncbi:hypothetical protein [Streptococcus suis]|uniref:hypothetical protein n=1 Tax=Streptococcus suis TaxID=1307 RepID=UPI002412CA5B|nr:hypothetical protein [Streptococcus suis]MDG4507953.1 hypothetical protein [Streptococcus suis]